MTKKMTATTNARDILKALTDDIERLKDVIPNVGEPPAIPDLPPFTIEVENFNGIKHLSMDCKFEASIGTYTTTDLFKFTAIVTLTRTTYEARGNIRASIYTSFPTLQMLERGKEMIEVWFDSVENVNSPYSTVGRRVLGVLNRALTDAFAQEWESPNLAPYRKVVREFDVYELRKATLRYLSRNIKNLVEAQESVMQNLDALDRIDLSLKKKN